MWFCGLDECDVQFKRVVQGPSACPGIQRGFFFRDDEPVAFEPFKSRHISHCRGGLQDQGWVMDAKPN
jgi:hypothetical protein